MKLAKAKAMEMAAKAHFISEVRAVNPELANTLESLRKKWYGMRNAVDEDTTEILIYEEIGGWWGIPASEFVSDLNAIKTKTIHVRINSPGGSVFDSIAMYNALVQHTADIHVYVDSLAASGASVIAMAGDKLTMMVGSQLMIHDASGVGLGDAREMREMAEFLDKQSDNISTVYADRNGGDPAEIRQMMLKETWMFADEAVELGFADEVYTKPAKPEEDTEDEDPEDPTKAPEEGEEDPKKAKPPVPPKDDDDEELEDLMRRRHTNLARLGYTYDNRLVAPAPDAMDDDELLDSIVNGFKTLKVGNRG